MSSEILSCLKIQSRRYRVTEPPLVEKNTLHVFRYVNLELIKSGYLRIVIKIVSIKCFNSSMQIIHLKFEIKLNLTFTWILIYYVILFFFVMMFLSNFLQI